MDSGYVLKTEFANGLGIVLKKREREALWIILKFQCCECPRCLHLCA